VNAELTWQKKTKNPEAKILLVIEDLDKLGLSDARQIFIQDPQALSETANSPSRLSFSEKVRDGVLPANSYRLESDLELGWV
jgi:hypothetical protein